MAMALTGKVAPYKAGFGPFPAEVYHAPFPIAYHGVSVQDSLDALEHIFKYDVEAARVAAIIIEPVMGEGGFYIAPAGVPAGAAGSSATSTASCSSSTRSRRDSRAPGRCSRSSTPASSRI